MNPYFYSITSLLAGEDAADLAPTHDKVVCHGKFTLNEVEYTKLPVPPSHRCGGCAAEGNFNLCWDMPDCGVAGGSRFIFIRRES